MTNFKTKLTSLILAACMLCAMSVSASAAEINQSGGSGTTPVNLTTTNGGIDSDGGLRGCGCPGADGMVLSPVWSAGRLDVRVPRGVLLL